MSDTPLVSKEIGESKDLTYGDLSLINNRNESK